MEFNQFGLDPGQTEDKNALIAKLKSIKQKLQAFKPLISDNFFQEIEQALVSSIGILAKQEAPAISIPGEDKKDFASENLKQFMNQLEQCQSQTEVLGNLVKFLSTLCQRIALFIVSGTSCIGWLASGFGEPGQGKKKITIPLNNNHVINNVFQSYSTYLGSPDKHPQNASLFQMIGGITPTEIMATPLIVKGKVAGIIYLDQGFSKKPISNNAEVEIACKMSSMTIDLLPIKKQYPPPPKQPEFKPEPPPVAVPQEEAVPQWQQPAKIPPSRPEQPPAPTFQAPSPQPPPPPPSAPPIPEAPPTKAEIPDTDQNLREDAKRLARLLVSEIKLYNEAKLAIAREERNIYQNLREDIERSRQMYNQRVPDSVKTSTRYFDEELVRILANGDPSLLGA